MVKRHPHSLTINWNDTGTKDGSGVYTPGSAHSKTIACNIQPKSGRYLIKEDGDRIDYSYQIFCDVFSEASSIPSGAKGTFLGKTLDVIRITVGQKHVEIFC